MAMQALGLFLLEMSSGTACLLIFFPDRVLGKGFFALHGAIALAAATLCWIVEPPGLAQAPAGVTMAALAAYTLVAYAGRVHMARPFLVVAAGFSLILLWDVVTAAAGGPSGWIFGGALLGGLLFGSVLLTMNLGHWYLVSRSLPAVLLFHAAAVYLGLCAARGAYMAAAAIVRPNPEGWESLTSLDREALFFLFRILWGVAGPLALSYFILRTARSRSNQAATGLLYVALVFVLIGELLASYLSVRTKFPA